MSPVPYGTFGAGGREKKGRDILVVAPVLPAFDRAAGHLRLYLLLRILAQNYRVIFFGGGHSEDPQSPRYIGALEEAGLEVHVAPQAAMGELLHLVDLCVFFEFFHTAERVLGHVRQQRPDLPIVIDSVDLHFLRELRGAQYSKRPWLATLRAQIIKRRELRVYRRADLILAVTDTDRSEILRELPDARVVVIPIIHEARASVPDFEERKKNSVLFVGGFRHSPNVDAVLFFCREVLPLVRRVLPDVTATIVGETPPREVQDLSGNGVVIAGWVPEITPYLDSHCAGIAPLRFGAGIKGKVSEALASGLPIVTTSIGAEGMDLTHGGTAMIADSADDFAEAVVRVCTDPVLHRRLSEAGRVHVRRQWDPVLIEKRVQEAFESLRALTPKTTTTRDRIADTARDVFARIRPPRKIERIISVATWYIGRVRRKLRPQ